MDVALCGGVQCLADLVGQAHIPPLSLGVYDRDLTRVAATRQPFGIANDRPLLCDPGGSESEVEVVQRVGQGLREIAFGDELGCMPLRWSEPLIDGDQACSRNG